MNQIPENDELFDYFEEQIWSGFFIHNPSSFRLYNENPIKTGLHYSQTNQQNVIDNKEQDISNKNLRIYEY